MPRVDDFRPLALKLFEIEKNRLLEEKQEYSCAVVIVVTPEGRYYEEAEVGSEHEMDVIYRAIVERAKANSATAIITINTGRAKDVEGDQELNSYRWGQLAEEDQPQCLFLTVSGPNIGPLRISLPFSLENDQVVLGEQTDFEAVVLSMLPNWT